MAVSNPVSGIFVCGVVIEMWTRSISAQKNAVWMRQLLEAMPEIEGVNTGVVHYWAASNGFEKPDGKIYQNTADDFEFLETSYENACHLATIPYRYLHPSGTLKKITAVPGHNTSLFNRMFGGFCDCYSRAEAASKADTYIEVWLENSSALSLIFPSIKRYNVNLVAAPGKISVGDVYEFVRRAVSVDRPIRLLHLSDYHEQNGFDKTKTNLEILCEKYCRRKDIRFEHLMLTKSQCDCLKLPAAPSREKTEINALEAVCPGLVKEMLESRLSSYVKTLRL